MERKQNRRKILKKLSNRYRLLIINETNLQEKTSISLTPFNVLLIGSTGLLLFSLISWGIFTLFPGFRDYAPGSGQTFDGRMKNEILRKISRLENELEMSSKRELAMKQIINGEEITAYDIPYKADKSRKVELTINETKADGSRVPDAERRIGRAKSEESMDSRVQPQLMDLTENEQDQFGSDFLFFSPVRGKIGSAFSTRTPWIDLLPQLDETVKAAMDGTVIFSGWTLEFGYVVSVQHRNNWISVYKFNSTLYKEPGSMVKAGETLGIAGYTDRENPETKLRFELWHNGIAVDPVNYVLF